MRHVPPITTMLWLLAVLAALMALGGAATAACGEMPSEETANRGKWFCDSGSDTVIVFVHGLFSSSRDAWLQVSAAHPDKPYYWPSLVLEDPLLELPPKSGRKPSVFLAGYYTRPDSGNSYRMADAQDQLMQALFVSVDARAPVIERKTTVFVAHSLGGVLVRDMLARHTERFAGKRLGLLLVASPSKGSGFANIGQIIQPAVQNSLIDELRTGNSYLDDVHRRFLDVIQPGGSVEALAGLEISEHLGMHESEGRCAVEMISGLYCTARKNLASYFRDVGVVVPRDSAEVYWKPGRLIPQSNHSTIARPTDLGHPSHFSLRQVFERAVKASASPCRPPNDFQFFIRLRPPDSAGQRSQSDGEAGGYRMHQLDPANGLPQRLPLSLDLDPISGLRSTILAGPPFACKGERFWAKLVPYTATNVLVPGRSHATDLCFRRSDRDGDAKAAFMHCVEGASCEVNKNDPGLAENCPPGDLVADAENQGDAVWTGEANGYWNVRSFDMLQRMSNAERPGYTEFHIVSERGDRELVATHFTYGVKVNDVPLDMDGKPPFLDRYPLGPGSRVHLTFAVENLGFNGGRAGDGQEQVEVELRFFDGNQPLKVAQLSRPYVAYRHAPLRQIADAATGETVEWRGYYRPAEEASFEVMLEHGTTADWMKFRRAELDSRKMILLGQPLVGVIRPGRRENSRIGMIAGLRMQTGQVKSLFTRVEADAICRWLQTQRGLDRVHRDRSYIFEFPLETFSDSYDRGRQVATCKQI